MPLPQPTAPESLGRPDLVQRGGMGGFGAPQHPPHCRCIARPLWAGGLAPALALVPSQPAHPGQSSSAASQSNEEGLGERR